MLINSYQYALKTFVDGGYLGLEFNKAATKITIHVNLEIINKSSYENIIISK